MGGVAGCKTNESKKQRSRRREAVADDDDALGAWVCVAAVRMSVDQSSNALLGVLFLLLACIHGTPESEGGHGPRGLLFVRPPPISLVVVGSTGRSSNSPRSHNRRASLLCQQKLNAAP